MKILLLLQALWSFSHAASFQLLSKEPLTDCAGCPAYLKPSLFVAPNFITQISKSQPDKAYLSQRHVVTTPNDIESVINFNMPAKYPGENCTFVFLFPKHNQVLNPYSYHGGGSFFLHGYNTGECADNSTTYNHQPKSGSLTDFPPIHMEPGHAYTIGVSPCSVTAGQCVAGSIRSNDTDFRFVQGAFGCSMGFYMVYDGGLSLNSSADMDL